MIFICFGHVSAAGKRASAETKPETPAPEMPMVDGDPLGGDSKYCITWYQLLHHGNLVWIPYLTINNLLLNCLYQSMVNDTSRLRHVTVIRKIFTWMCLPSFQVFQMVLFLFSCQAKLRSSSLVRQMRMWLPRCPSKSLPRKKSSLIWRWEQPCLILLPWNRWSWWVARV